MPDKINTEKKEIETNHGADFASVLIIDDELINLEVMSGMLESRNIKSEQATSGPHALALIQQRVQYVTEGKTDMYKLFLLDYSMPEMDGP